MNFDPGSVFASLLIGSVGVAAFMYGKRQSRFPHMLVGALLVVYPYFVPNVFVMVGIAVGLVGALFAAIKLGL